MNVNRRLGVLAPPSGEDDWDDEYLPSKVDPVADVKSKLKKLEIQSNHFWRIWKSEYLLSLRERPTHHRQNKSTSDLVPKLDEVVVVADKDSPRALWKVGRIVQLNKSNDGLVRSANVLLPNKRVLRRSTRHLYPLELYSRDGDEKIVNDTSVEIVDDVAPTLNTDSVCGLNSHCVDDTPVTNRPVRQAAVSARSRLAGILADSDDSE